MTYDSYGWTTLKSLRGPEPFSYKLTILKTLIEHARRTDRTFEGHSWLDVGLINFTQSQIQTVHVLLTSYILVLMQTLPGRHIKKDNSFIMCTAS